MIALFILMLTAAALLWWAVILSQSIVLTALAIAFTIFTLVLIKLELKRNKS